MPVFHNGKGVGLPPGTFKNPDLVLDKLGATQFINWDFHMYKGKKYKKYFNPMIYNELVVNDGLKNMMYSNRNAWLFLNEPDIGRQANMTATDAANEYIKILKWNVPFRSMAPNVCLDRLGGWGWLDDFRILMSIETDIPGRGKIKPLDAIEAYGVHCYGLKHNSEIDIVDSFNLWWKKLREWMQKNNCVKQVIITEVNAGSYDVDVQEKLLRHLNNLSWDFSSDFYNLQAYFWFAAKWGKKHNWDLIDKNYNLTHLGRVFKSL